MADSTSEVRETSEDLWRRGRHQMLAVVFNGGLLLVVVAFCWELWFGVPSFAPGRYVWLCLICVGASAAVAAWIAGAAVRRVSKAIIVGLAMAATLLVAWSLHTQWNRDASILQNGRMERGRFVHDGLGLSFKVPPGAQTLLEIAIGPEDDPIDANRTGLKEGESATLFRIRSPMDSGGRQSPIKLNVSPFRFSRIDSVVIHVMGIQSSLCKISNTRLIQPIRHSHLGKLDMIDFEVSNPSGNGLKRYVFVRSGGYLVNFVLNAPSTNDRFFFDQFVKSIDIQGHTTEFNF